MAKAVITFKLMPESPEIDLGAIKEQALAIAKEAGSIGEMRAEEEPIAFGLKALKILAMYDVEGSEFDQIAEKMSQLAGVQSAEVAKMDLALG
jgi:elongation factor 1-beta